MHELTADMQPALLLSPHLSGSHIVEDRGNISPVLFSCPKGVGKMYFDQVAFGKRIKELRMGKGLSQEAAAEQLNVSGHHYSSIERGVRGCSLDLLIDLATFFNVSTDYLLLGKRPDREAEICQLKEIQMKLEDLIRTI